MNKKQFIEAFHQELKKKKRIKPNVNITYSNKIVDTFLNSIQQSLQIGDRVNLRKFGSFEIRNYNFPKQKLKKIPFFKVSPLLRKKIAENKNDSLD